MLKAIIQNAIKPMEGDAQFVGNMGRSAARSVYGMRTKLAMGTKSRQLLCKLNHAVAIRKIYKATGQR